jgi:peptidoglycan/LPS O-acetylase OafA/YrhL
MVTGHHTLRARRFYYPQLDGLRFVAFAAVFVSHLRLETPNPWSEVPPRSFVEWWFRSTVLSGAFGVDLFFVLSSFLITSLLIREADTRGRLNLPAFWIRRILRIWPLYFAFLVPAGVAQHLPRQPFLLCGVFLGNWAYETYGLDRFVIGPLWSVSVEEQFYVAWPLVLLLVPRRRLPWVCAALIASSVTVRALMLALGVSHTEIWMNTVARLDPIAIGALIALRWQSRPASLSAPARVSVLAGVPLAIVAYVGWVAHSVPPLPLSPLGSRGEFAFFASYVLMYLVSAVGCGAVIVAALCSRRSLLAHPSLVYLGRISYGLYVFHRAAI